jgi:AraC-like DNA-binding protein
MIFGLCLKLIFLVVARAVSVLGLSRREAWWKDAEILILRHQLAVALRERPRAHSRLTWPDRAWLALLAGTLPAERLAGLRLIVTPATILRWHRDIVRDDHPAIPLDKDARWAAILAYLRRHARDRDLNAERAAHALGISSSALSRLARQQGASIPQIILAHKLEGARRNIERFGRVRGVGWIARRWGFADADQLRQLLREANAVTANDWPPVPPRSPASDR